MSRLLHLDRCLICSFFYTNFYYLKGGIFLDNSKAIDRETFVYRVSEDFKKYRQYVLENNSKYGIFDDACRHCVATSIKHLLCTADTPNDAIPNDVMLVLMRKSNIITYLTNLFFDGNLKGSVVINLEQLFKEALEETKKLQV